MQTHRSEAIVREDGTLVLTGTPFRPGERVEVIAVGPVTGDSAERYPLRGKPYRFDRPTDPVGTDDWEALK